MQKRERILLFAVIAIVLGAYIVPRAYGLFTGPVEDRRRQLAELQERVGKQRVEEAQLRVAGRVLDGARALSLPRNVDDAQRLYLDWMYGIVDVADFADATVKPDSRKPHGNVFTAVSLKVEGNATLEKLGRFLYAFHRIDLPHRIDAIELIATGAQPDSPLTVKLTATALAFRDGPDRPFIFPRTTLAGELKSDGRTLEVADADGFPQKPDFRVRIGREYLTVTATEGNHWTVARAADDTRPQPHKQDAYLELAPINPEFADVAPADYYGKLAKNSPFAKPQPKPPVSPRSEERRIVVRDPPRQARRPEPDPAAKFTYFGSFVQYDDRPQVRMYDRRDGKLTVLHVGERFKIGTIEGRIASIDHDHVVITNDDGTFRLPLGETLVYMEKVGDPLAGKSAPNDAPPSDADARLTAEEGDALDATELPLTTTSADDPDAR